jgi:bifunctional enzyme CysN/CysC
MAPRDDLSGERFVDRETALPIVILGHVDHGKSSLVGRLLHDTDSLPEGRVEHVRDVSKRRGRDFEWSFVIDALQIERDQGITLDTARIWFKTAKRRYVIIDAPGHAEFLKNMLTGASGAEAAVLVVDIAQGVSEQTRRHAYLARLLGLRHVIVALNKMDLVGYSAARFEEVMADLNAYLAGIGLSAQGIVPISAKEGDNIVQRSAAMPWYAGRTLVDELDRVQTRPSLAEAPLRLPIQDVYRLGERRAIAGRIDSGTLSVGDEISFWPGGVAARVASFEEWGRATPRTSAEAGRSVAIVLDREIVAERGMIVSKSASAPTQTTTIATQIFWFAPEPLEVGRTLKLRLGTATHDVVVTAIDHVVDVNDLSQSSAQRIERNGVGRVVLRSGRPMVVDRYADHPRGGRGVLSDRFAVVAACVVDEATPESARRVEVTVPDSVAQAERAAANGHRGGVLWLTGLPAAGKSTIAQGVQRRLFDAGWQVSVLDGDAVRQGLNRDLGFDSAARSENIRRVAEVARLMSTAGSLVLVALVSPTRADRAMARATIGDAFREVYVGTSAETCRQRDPKGHYRDATAGKIATFTGVSAKYEAPDAPDLTLGSAGETVEQGVARLYSFARDQFEAAAPTGQARS